jgi:HTH-type transcriptional regulator/antitoxin HipB
MNYPIRFAEQLREHIRGLRKKRGMTQAQLGRLLGVGQARIAEIEGDPGAISVEQLVNLLSALGVGLSLQESEWPAVAPSQLQISERAVAVKKGARKAVKKAASSAVTSGHDAAPLIKPKKGAW